METVEQLGQKRYPLAWRTAQKLPTSTALKVQIIWILASVAADLLKVQPMSWAAECVTARSNTHEQGRLVNLFILILENYSLQVKHYFYHNFLPFPTGTIHRWNKFDGVDVDLVRQDKTCGTRAFVRPETLKGRSATDTKRPVVHQGRPLK